MSRQLTPLGYRYDVVPIQPVPEATTYLDVGVLSIGVEYRLLTDDIVNASIDEAARVQSGIEDDRPAAPIDEQGVSIHVCDLDRKEYLRFDNFGDDPHYHYIVPGEYNIIVPYDYVANGPFQDWARDRLRLSLVGMLHEAGAHELADAVDPAVIQAALPEIDQLVERATAASNGNLVAS